MDWLEFESEVIKLSEQIKLYNPQIIMGITRGGMFPAFYLSELLHVQEFSCITVEKDGPKRRVVTSIKKDLKNKRVLLVEDMLESGLSLIAAKEYLQLDKLAEVKTACLYVMTTSNAIPNFYLKVVRTVQEFPWEKQV